jgi:hypothetical protein
MFAVKRHEISNAEAVDKGKAVQRKPEATSPSPINPIWHRLTTHVPGVQAKLKIGQPGEKYEQEADRVAEKVMRMPESSIRRKPSLPFADDSRCGDDELKIQTKPAEGGNGAAQVGLNPLIKNVLSSPGQPLDAATRCFMEPRFGQSFRGVRVHVDSGAAESARAVSARAFTVGSNVVFANGEYIPGTNEGRWLLAHELAHVVQQSGSTRSTHQTEITAAPASSSATIATSQASRMVQRQPAGTRPVAAQTLTDNIKDAIKLLRQVQPLFIHQALSAVPINYGSVPVHSVEHLSGGKRVTSVFTLELKVAKLAGFTLAKFQATTGPAKLGGTQMFAMTITVSERAATFPPETLARDLLHEGMHMQLFVDRAVPSWSASLYISGFQDYLAAARKDHYRTYALLFAELTDFIKKNGQGKTQAVAAREAREIVEKIIEEKYVIDAVKQSRFGTRAAPLRPTERQQHYRSLTTRWLVTYLSQVGVNNRPEKEIGGMASKLVSLWLEIDRNAPRPPRYPVPIGVYQEPMPEKILLAPPLPAPIL